MTHDSAIVGLINPKNVSNVGGVVRAANCFGVSKILYTGTRYDRAVRFQTDTKNAAVNLPLQHTDNVFDASPSDHRIVSVELAIGAMALPDFKHPSRAVYLFGPEDGTLSQELIDGADSVVFIPARSCLNLAATVNVVLYDRLAKQARCTSPGEYEQLEGNHQKGNHQKGKQQEYDQLIRDSRDCRNRVKVR